MSDNSQIIVDLDATEDDAERLAATIRQWLIAEGIIEEETSDSVLGGEGHRPGPNHLRAVEKSDPHLLGLATNGMEIRVGRQVFETSGNGIELACAGCGLAFEPDESWFDAAGKWAEGDDAAVFACPGCKRSDRLRDWGGPWRWAFGHLGFELWNWPPLSARFLQSLAEKLGHRTVLIRRHL